MSAIQTEARRPAWAGRDSTAPLLTPGTLPSPAPGPRPRPQPRALPRSKAAARLRRGLGAIALAGGMAAAAVAGSVAVAQQGFAVDAARAQTQRLQGQNRQLTAELAALQSPQRVLAVAVGGLGMQRPAGYLAVPARPVPPAPAQMRAGSAQAVLPVPAGPAPGSVVAIAGGVHSAVAGAWRRMWG